MKTHITMKTHIRNLSFGFVLMLAGPTKAQTFTVLHGFTVESKNSLGVYTNGGGAFPVAGLVQGSAQNRFRNPLPPNNERIFQQHRQKMPAGQSEEWIIRNCWQR